MNDGTGTRADEAAFSLIADARDPPAAKRSATSGGDVLCVSVGGGKSIASASEELALALFDVYLGDDPVSDAAFNAFTKGVAKLVAPF